MMGEFAMTDDAFWKKCYMIALKGYLSPKVEGRIISDTAERAGKFAAKVADDALKACGEKYINSLTRKGDDRQINKET